MADIQLEAEFQQLKKEYNDLESDNVELYQQNNELKAEIIRLMKQIEDNYINGNLQLQLITSNNDNIIVQQVIKELEKGKDWNCLYRCNTVNAKRLLLEELFSANNSYNYNIILTVLLYLQASLAPKVFLNLIKQFPSALSVYINHLESTAHKQENVLLLSNLYQSLGRHEESCIKLVEYAMLEGDLHIRQNQLKKAALEFNKCNLSWHSKVASQHADLLERQLMIQALDNIQEQSNNKSRMSVSKSSSAAASVSSKTISNRPKSILSTSLCTTLIYCLYNYPQVNEVHLCSALGLKKQFNYSETAYIWQLLIVKAAQRDYEGLKATVPKGNWLSSMLSGPKSAIGSFEPYLDILNKEDSPLDIKEYFCNLIADREEKYKLAMQYQLFELAIKLIQDNKLYSRLASLSEEIIRVLGSSSDRSAHLRQLINIFLQDPKVQKALK
jgi:hypothetical protein